MKRLAQWFRSSDHIHVVPLAEGPTAEMPEAVDDELARQADLVAEALQLMTESHQHASTRLRKSIDAFRGALQTHRRGETLDRAWTVQQAWHKLRSVEATLLMLRSQTDSLRARSRLGSAPGFQAPPKQPATTSARA